MGRSYPSELLDGFDRQPGSQVTLVMSLQTW